MWGSVSENTRVGQITNYDKLTLYLETDGSVTPEEAFSQAVTILMDHFQALKNESVAGEKKKVKVEKKIEEKESENQEKTASKEK